MKKHQYLFHLQYLGYRYHGWQKQPTLKTIESMLQKTVRCIFGPRNGTIIGASRTDAKVSAHHGAFALVIHESFSESYLKDTFNENLPPDIRILHVEKVNREFNIITASKYKEYIYLFSFGEKAHPFSAPLMCSFPDDLDIPAMKQGAEVFRGTHNFRQYCATPKPDTEFKRTIITSEITENTVFTANFFPATSYLYRIRAQGFMRHQVRLLFGQLIRLGRGEITIDDIITSLQGNNSKPLRYIAPASGLQLYTISFSDSDRHF